MELGLAIANRFREVEERVASLEDMVHRLIEANNYLSTQLLEVEKDAALAVKWDESGENGKKALARLEERHEAAVSRLI